MPIVDGLEATKMIRKYEESSPDSTMSDKAKSIGRVPIFAVSASLVEKDAQKYVDIGFDGYIMKPIDFKRVDAVLCGLQGDREREALTYVPGNWENGGWFKRPQVSSEPGTQPDTAS